MDDDTLKLDTRGLDGLMKALKGKLPVVRIGILGNRNSRSKGGSNAAIGAIHEFGSSELPVRSFLRVPLADHLQKTLEKNGALDKDTIAQVIKVGSIVPWLQKVAITAEEIVLTGFDTGGYGKWKPSNMAHKKVHQTLVETQQLRNSITSEVK